MGRASATRYRRSPGATWRQLRDSMFLTSAERGAVYRANETAQALWRLLADPVTIAEAVEVFRAAFPREPAEEVARAIEEAFGELSDEGLIEEVDR